MQYFFFVKDRMLAGCGVKGMSDICGREVVRDVRLMKLKLEFTERMKKRGK